MEPAVLGRFMRIVDTELWQAGISSYLAGQGISANARISSPDLYPLIRPISWPCWIRSRVGSLCTSYCRASSGLSSGSILIKTTFSGADSATLSATGPSRRQWGHQAAEKRATTVCCLAWDSARKSAHDSVVISRMWNPPPSSLCYEPRADWCVSLSGGGSIGGEK